MDTVRNLNTPIPSLDLNRDDEFRILVSSVKEYAIFMIDPTGLIKTWNDGAKNINGYEADEILGKHISVFYTKDDIEKGVIAKNLEIAKAQRSFEDEGWRVKKDGTVFWANVIFTAIYNEQHELTGFIKVTRDISNQKKIKDDLALEQVIQEQKNITKAVVNAQEKERAEIGMELHDNVNQLLAASNLSLNLALSQQDHAPFILQSREYIVKAIEEIRKLSHVLVGPAHEKTMGLIAAVEELISNLSILKDIIISFNYSTYDEKESEMGLKIVIYRIIQEQMSNILKHAEASEVKIELKKEENDLILVITDNGKGFNTSAKRKGIGLKNIKYRAELYDGTVKIVCPAGKGCQMMIVFKGNSYNMRKTC